MKCEQVILYANGELTGDEKIAFEAHLQTCGQCRAELQFLQKADEALVAKAVPEKVVDSLFAKTTRKKKWFSGWKPIVAGVCAVGLIGIMVFPRPDKDTLHTEVSAYMSENLDADYQAFENDLSMFEQQFKEEML
ncbi:MAG: zf-HC2 domain-containing protein [Elusimicrobiaceae bacterium]|nr:zf-HC2 domain-containing protein [Elusimicrobiaceae bacterium]